MCIRAQLGREALDERDGAALWGSHFPVLSRTSPELGKEGTQEGMELLLDEAGHGLFASLRARQEGPEFLLDDVVEDALFGVMSCVAALRTSTLRVRRM